MKLTPEQSIKIFGWWDQPREYMNWDDVKTKELSWRDLRLVYGFSALELKRLQPDKDEWLKRSSLSMHDVWDMHVFPVNPFSDFRADLAEVWRMKWPPETLQSMGVTFTQLQEEGMSPEIMRQFGFSLSAWQKLGLRDCHVTPAISAIFGMPLDEVKQILSEHSVVHKVSAICPNK